MLTQIVWHESRGNPNAVGDHGLARGITQYHRNTFYEHAKIFGLEHPEWLDTQDQLFLLRKALQDAKYARAWTGYRASGLTRNLHQLTWSTETWASYSYTTGDASSGWIQATSGD